MPPIRAITLVRRQRTRIPARGMETMDTQVRPHMAIARPPSTSLATPTAGLATLAATATVYAREATRLAATAKAFVRGAPSGRHEPRSASGRSAGAHAAPP